TAPATAPATTASPPPPATPPELTSELPGARWRGTGVLRFLGLHIYDAQLWSAQAIAGDGAAQSLALVLVYARQLVGEQIASRSLKEMSRISRVDDEQSARWLKAMTQLFPDVRDGDRLTGVQRPGVATRFFLNGQFRGELADAEFTRLFFGIWLSPRTSEPRLREQLLGGRS
ncbi:MAG: chalcone isomerase family protein, partial [Microbacteriaceae bacterium]|nr:chalcone isomerase family protein [Burkholderiaceae bacterium]